MNSSPSSIQRMLLSQAQLYEAQNTGYITPEEIARRRHIVTHPIDNVTPDIASDRDDGIFVEAATRRDGYRVYVTIADVAAHVPPDSALGKVAHERAFTVYRPEMIDSMFPKALEDRMSLEHEKERLGLTVAIDLDANYNVVHTSFERTLTVGDNTDYAMAQARMRHDPQFALMGKIAKGMRAHMKEDSAAALEEIKSTRNNASLSLGDIEVRKMVETYMLRANEVVATFMHRAKEPLLYRNFEDDAKGADGVSRAYYSTRSKRHDALQRDGLTGSYCHFTSPIRRGPDFYNAHMVHYVIDQVEPLEAALAARFPSLDRAGLHIALWDAAPDLLVKRKERVRGTSNFVGVTAILTDMLTGLGVTPVEIDAARLESLAIEFRQTPPPMSISQLDRYALRINKLNASEAAELARPELRQWLTAIDRREEAEISVLGQTRESLQKADRVEFSDILRKAATNGIMTDDLKEETLSRLQTNRLDAAQDAYRILIVAAFSDPQWLELKRAICRAIKNDAAIVNGVFDQIKKNRFFEEEALSISEAQLPVHSDQSLPQHSGSMHAAIVTLKRPHFPTRVSAPYFSIGHNALSALSHAKYSFLEHYTFGQLQPLDQSSIPNLLYADLNHANSDRIALVREMAESIGASFRTVEFDDRKGRHHVRAIVKGGTLHEPIVAQATSDESNPEAQAVRRLLRGPGFKAAFNFSNLSELQSTLQPVRLLESHLKRESIPYSTQVDAKPVKPGRFLFHAAITIGTGPNAERFEASNANKQRATMAAAMQALAAHGWVPPDHLQLKVKSWTREPQDGPTR